MLSTADPRPKRSSLSILLSREQVRWEMKSQEQQRKGLPEVTEAAITRGVGKVSPEAQADF